MMTVIVPLPASAFLEQKIDKHLGGGLKDLHVEDDGTIVGGKRDHLIYIFKAKASSYYCHYLDDGDISLTDVITLYLQLM